MVARAKTGSGKTFAYLLPLLQKLFTDSGSKNKLAPSAFVLVPTRELSQQVQLIISSLICNDFPYCFVSELKCIMYCQVYTEVSSLIELCRVQLKVVQLTSSMTASDLVCSILRLLLFLKKYKYMYTYSHKDAPSYMPILLSFVILGHTIPRCFANSYLADSFLILNTDCSGLH